MKKKAVLVGLIGITSFALITVLICVFVIHGINKKNTANESQRSVKIIDMGGFCQVLRNNDKIDASVNMELYNGDIVEVGDNGFARIRLDEDKLLYLDKGTKIQITATGDAATSKTSIFVERGSLMTEVLNKLSQESSFTVVTANTIMNIRGTKTLTEVIEDAVTGHVQTSNAVLEGQVKIKGVKVKSDGTVVSVEKDLGAGEGNAFSSVKEELVSQEEMQAISETGASLSGVRVEIVSEEEADVVFDVAIFESTFLESIKSILIADAEANAKEDLSQEEIDSLNSQLDNVMRAFEEIREASNQKILSLADNRNPEPSNNPEPIIEPSTTPIIFDDPTILMVENNNDEGTTIVSGDTNLIVIFDGDESKKDESGPTEIDNSELKWNEEEERKDRDKLEWTDEEERLFQEEHARDEKEEEDRLVREEEEKLAREEKEILAREEQEKKAREEKERLDREEKKRLDREEKERLIREEERLAREEEEERLAREEERLAREEAERLAQQQENTENQIQEQQNSSSVNISYEETAWEIETTDDLGMALRLSFWVSNPETGEFEELDREEEWPLPESLPHGSALPGTETSEGNNIYIFVSKSNIVATSDGDIEVWEKTDDFSFIGWHIKNEDGEYSLIEYVPEDENVEELELYGKIEEKEIFVVED